MREVHIVFVDDDELWEAREAGTGVVVEKAPLKVDCVRFTAEWAEAQGEPISVRIHFEDGRFEEERTYPRSADPQESAG